MARDPMGGGSVCELAASCARSVGRSARWIRIGQPSGSGSRDVAGALR